MSTAVKDAVKWYPRVVVEKFDPDQVAFTKDKLNLHREPTPAELSVLCTPEYTRSEGNLLTTAGLTRLTSLLTGGGGVVLSNTTCRIGTGNSSTAAAVGQTDLQASAGSGNRFFMTMAATYPTVSAGLLTFQAIFGISDGNYAWSEWCVDVAAATVTSGVTVNALMFNRAVASLGTKVSGAIWTFTTTVTFS